MNFAENLKQIRREHRLSQEDLAEMLDVSRQAVSKWEQGQGYPEVETLLRLSEKLNVSPDALLSREIDSSSDGKRPNANGEIIITSPYENVIVTCYKVAASAKMRGGKRSPQYALFGVSRGAASFWGEPTTFLGWYRNEEQISKEIEAIHQASLQGRLTYTLQYSARTERRWASVKIVES